MDLLALALVLISAGMHATWNFWAKRASDSVSFLWGFSAVMPLIAGAVVLGEWLFFGNPPNFTTWKLAILGGVIQAAYISLMGAGYNRGDLSVVYPVSRGTAPLIIAVIAWLFLRETPSAVGLLGICIILGGAVLLSWDMLFRNGPSPSAAKPTASLGCAALAAVTIALYHVVDKAGAQGSSVTSYQFLMEVVIVIALTPLLFIRRRAAKVKAEFREHGALIFGASLFGYVAYALVITAMMRESVAYVAAARNVSILIGIALGATQLREGKLGLRLIAGALLLGGIVTLAVGG